MEIRKKVPIIVVTKMTQFGGLNLIRGLIKNKIKGQKMRSYQVKRLPRSNELLRFWEWITWVIITFLERDLATFLKFKIHISFHQVLPLLGVKEPIDKDRCTEIFTAAFT